MTRTTRATLQIVLALILSLAAAFLVFRWMSTQQAQAPAPTKIAVVIAARDIKPDTTLADSMLETKRIDMTTRPVGAFTDPAAIEKRIAELDITAGQIITEAMLRPENLKAKGISNLIAPGKRAVAVKGNEVMGLAGFVRPGDRVDVLVSTTVGKQEKPVTKLVLEHIKVLATGTELEHINGNNPETKLVVDSKTAKKQRGAQGRTGSVDVYTLEVTPQESERLALAATRGTLHFALRNSEDNATVLTHGSTVEQAINAYRPKPPARKVVRSNSVEVITGADKTRVKF